jgi:hypothetical protein
MEALTAGPTAHEDLIWNLSRLRVHGQLNLHLCFCNLASLPPASYAPANSHASCRRQGTNSVIKHSSNHVALLLPQVGNVVKTIHLRKTNYLMRWWLTI